MLCIETIAALRRQLAVWRHSGASLALVPTMGNLHRGHLSLVEEARHQADRVVVSIFVNPTQFAPGEDYGSYPRTPERDSELLRAAGADLLFMPGETEVYPPAARPATYVEVPELSEQLCGSVRPGHFRGVTTVVCKLFNLVQPDIALFGDKDYQQLTLIRRMVADLDIPVRIVGMPTVREPDGLAMSSRNSYLNPDEKRQAARLYAVLQEIAGGLRAGNRDYPELERRADATLRSAGFLPDYVAIRTPDLSLPTATAGNLVILAAARLGKARLIDNLQIAL